MGVSLNRVDRTGLGVARGLENGDGAKGGGGVWLREVELLRLVLRFSRGVGDEEARRAEEAVVEEEGGRFSIIPGVLEEADPGLLGAGFRFGLCRVPVAAVGDDTMACALSSPNFSHSSPAVGLLATHVWLRTDVAVEQSGREDSED